MPQEPLVAGRYRVEARLGIGGMAEVVLARDTALRRPVALKLLAPALAGDPVFVERFRREATAIASLSHANVVVIYDHGMAEGQPFIAMEYVSGRTLKQIITARAPLAPAVAVGYACQALAGLEAAHSVGIIHRDIKPQNLLVREDDTLKVADFGVARSAQETVLTQHGSVIGTAEYIAPEQARGASAVAASDLYSVGVVLFEMLTGRLPFSGDLAVAVANQHALEPAPRVREINPAIPVALANVVDRTLSKEPAQRYDSAAEMKAALSAATQPDPAATLIAPPPVETRVMPAAPPRRSPRAGRLTRQRALAALVALILLLGGAFALTTGRGGALPVVPLPQLVGTSVPTARSSLQKLGLEVRVAPARHATTASGTVARIRPSSAAALGSVVTITPSSGPRRIEIPPVFGLSSEAASSELAGLGFVVRTRTSYTSSPQATAVGTTPAAGTPAPPHSPVELIISAGPAPVAPPPAPVPGKAKDHAKDTGKGKHHKKHE